jgi:hypothetical protein
VIGGPDAREVPERMVEDDEGLDYGLGYDQPLLCETTVDCDFVPAGPA